MRIVPILAFIANFAAVACSSGQAQSPAETGSERGEDASPIQTQSSAQSSAHSSTAPTASPTPELDQQLEAFLAAPGLDARYLDDWSAARSAKMSEAKAVNEPIKARIAQTDDRDVKAHLSIQRSRIFLAVACQMVGIKPAPDADEESARLTSVYGAQAADLFFPGVDESLRDAVAADGARSGEAGQLLLKLRSTPDRRAFCDDSRSLWRP